MIEGSRRGRFNEAVKGVSVDPYFQTVRHTRDLKPSSDLHDMGVPMRQCTAYTFGLLFFACSERISGSSFSDEGCLRFPLGFRFQENPTLLMCLLLFFIFFAIPVSSSCYCLGLREYPGRPMCWSPEGTLVGLTAHLFLCGRWGWNSPSPRDCTGAYCSRTARGSSFGLPWIRQLCVPTTLSDNTCIEVERDCTCY